MPTPKLKLPDVDSTRPNLYLRILQAADKVRQDFPST